MLSFSFCTPQLPIVASSMISLYFLELTDVLQPAKVGFRCHDRALSMPYIETGDELIPLLMLLSLAFAGPAASVSTTHLSCLHSFDVLSAKDETEEKCTGRKKKNHGWMLHGKFHLRAQETIQRF